MAISPGWYDSANDPIAAPVAVSGTGGTPGTAVVVKLINGKGVGTASAITNARLLALCRAAGSTDAFVERGRPILDRQMLECRVASGYNATLPASDWVALGRGQLFDKLPSSIASDVGVVLELRVNAPGSAQDVDEEVRLELIDDLGRLIAAGVSQAGHDGVCLPLGDPSGYVVLRGADIVEDSGGPSGDVETPEFVGVIAGRMRVLRAGTQAIAASAAGNSRYVGVVIDATGAWDLVEGVETSDPLTAADYPAIAADLLLWAWVEVDDSGAIADAAINNVWTVGAFGLTYSASSLDITVHGGPYAVVADGLVYQTGQSLATLTASATNRLWMLASGAYEVTQDDVPATAQPALLLAELDTDGSGVTAYRDRRVLAGGNALVLLIEFRGTLSTSAWGYATSPWRKPSWLDPFEPIVASIAVQTTDHTTGATRFDVQVLRGSTWTSFFAADADKPQIAHNAAADALLATDIVPDRYDLPAHAQIRAKPDDLPTGGSDDPDDGVVALLLRAV